MHAAGGCVGNWMDRPLRPHVLRGLLRVVQWLLWGFSRPWRSSGWASLGSRIAWRRMRSTLRLTTREEPTPDDAMVFILWRLLLP